jgi:isopentenyldiphosphate isomerase
VGMMNVYDKSVQDIQKYLQWPEINFLDEYPIPFVFFQKLKDAYEFVNAEVQSKEFISKEDIQEFFVKATKEFPLYNAFIHKFMVDMKSYKECHLTSNNV